MPDNYNNDLVNDVESNIANNKNVESETQQKDCLETFKTSAIEEDDKSNKETIAETHPTVTQGPEVDLGSKNPTTASKDIGTNQNNNSDKENVDVVSENADNTKTTGKSFAKLVLSAIVFGMIASITFLASNTIFKELSEDAPTVNEKFDNELESTELVIGDEDEEVISTSISKVVENVMPSVVSITNLSIQEVEYFFFGTQQYETENNGSGVIVGKNNDELLIMTNNHVVEGYKTLTVSFIDEESVEATVKGTDPDIDLAIVSVPLKSIKSETLDKIRVATMGNSNALTVGEPAIAIGNALGYGQSVTSGIISALGRTIDGLETKLIQTDAAINPGNSGGALLNIKGAVIGINTVKVNADAVEGMGYAIPISDVEEILQGLMNRETREKVDKLKRGVLGISGLDVDDNASLYYNMPKGCYISEIAEGGAAEKAGIPKGCILTRFDGLKISGMVELKEQMSYYEAGETIDVVVEIPQPNGEYEEETFTVTLDSNANIQSN